MNTLDQLEAKILEISVNKDRDWAVANFSPVVNSLIRLTGAKSILEIGGGRAPYLSQEVVDQLGLQYTSSDISQHELELAPGWVNPILLDIQDPDKSKIAPYKAQFDFAFSKWVMEHVANYRRAYSNIYDILDDDGVHIAYHPILFSLPFVINKVLPDAVTAPLLRTFFPNRNDEDTPKFPVHYSGCRISSKVRQDLRDIGFRRVWQLPFYGHNYYSKIPGVREVHAALTRQLRDINATTFASFSYTIVQK